MIVYFYRFKVQGSRFKVQGSGFRVRGSGFKVRGSKFRGRGAEFKEGARCLYPKVLSSPSSLPWWEGLREGANMSFGRRPGAHQTAVPNMRKSVNFKANPLRPALKFTAGRSG